MSQTKYHSSMVRSLYALGRDDMVGRYFKGKGGGYNDSKVIGKYKVEFDDDEKDLRIFIWRKEAPCLVAVISKEDSFGVIDMIEYNPECSIENMERGKGTRDMIEFAIKLLKENGAKVISLSDKSTIQCGKLKIRLGPMYFLKYGMTWYEKYFGFKPDKKYATKYEQMKKKREELLDIESIQYQPCEFFTDETIDEIFEYLGFVFFNSISWSMTEMN